MRLLPRPLTVGGLSSSGAKLAGFRYNEFISLREMSSVGVFPVLTLELALSLH
jgi:hypothetical protein